MQGSNSDAHHSNPSLSSKEKNDTPGSASLTKRGEYLLPPLSVEHRDRKTLVLDLDETLVHASNASNAPLPHYDFLLDLPPRGNNDRVILHVLKRPGVHEFLEEAAKLFEVVVFTASVQKYADAALDQLDVNGTLISHRLYQSQCSKVALPSKDGGEKKVRVKDLSRLGRDLSKTIIVDNNPFTYIMQRKNGLRISSYVEYDLNDRELNRVMSYLRIVVKQNRDVRDVLQQLQEQLKQLQ